MAEERNNRINVCWLPWGEPHGLPIVHAPFKFRPHTLLCLKLNLTAHQVDRRDPHTTLSGHVHKLTLDNYFAEIGAGPSLNTNGSEAAASLESFSEPLPESLPASLLAYWLVCLVFMP